MNTFGKLKRSPVAVLRYDSADIQRKTHEAMAKLFALFKIERGDYRQLAFRLALSGGLVELEMPKKASGRRMVWTQLEQILLWANVEMIRLEKPKPSIVEACARLKRAGRWKGRGALRHNYFEGKKQSPAAVLSAVEVRSPEDWSRAIRAIAGISGESARNSMIEVMIACVLASEKSGIVPSDSK